MVSVLTGPVVPCVVSGVGGGTGGEEERMYRGITKKILLALIVGGSLGSVGLTGVASAGANDPAAGWIKICKASPVGGQVTVTPASFQFSIDGSASYVTVAVGSCSMPISVSGGSHTVAEVNISPTYSVTNIAELPGGTYITGTNLTTSAVGGIPAMGASVAVDGITAELDFTNQVNVGYVEVCKSTPATSGITGPFNYTVAGPTGSNFTKPVTVTVLTPGVQSCSSPFLAPVGANTVTEAGTNLYVTGISANENFTGPNELVGSPNLKTGTAVVTVLPERALNDTSIQTDVNYSNNVVSLEICKLFDTSTASAPANSSSSASFPFTMTATLSTLGQGSTPFTPSSSASDLAGQCSNPVSYLPGTTVTITEGIVPGSKVETIGVTGAASVVTGSLSTPNRTVQVVIGTLTSSPSAPTNAAIVTFTNQYANPGLLKICKVVGTLTTTNGPPVGTVFNFTINGGTALTSVSLGNCTTVGTLNAAGTVFTPTPFPYDSTVLVTEQPTTSNVASAISVVPTFVTQGNNVATNVPSASSVSLGTVGGSSSVMVTISENPNAVTEVTFADVDPPVIGTAPVTVGNPITIGTSAGGPGTTTAMSVSTATAVAATIPSVLASSSGSLTTITVKLTKAQEKALLKSDEKMLKSTNAAISKWTKVVARTHGKAHRTAVKHLSGLRSERVQLNAMTRRLTRSLK